MTKDQYYNQVKMLMGESKEELIQRILSLENTQTHDMYFVQNKLNNGEIQFINRVFNLLADVARYTKTEKLYQPNSTKSLITGAQTLSFEDKIEIASRYWTNISAFLDDIADSSRIANELKVFKDEVNTLKQGGTDENTDKWDNMD